MTLKLTACVDESPGCEAPVTLVGSALDPHKKGRGILLWLKKNSCKNSLNCNPQSQTFCRSRFRNSWQYELATWKSLNVVAGTTGCWWNGCILSCPKETVKMWRCFVWKTQARIYSGLGSPLPQLPEVGSSSVCFESWFSVDRKLFTDDLCFLPKNYTQALISS